MYTEPKRTSLAARSRHYAAVFHRRPAETAKTFLGERYRRIARRRGSKRAIVALGRSILVIAWHLLNRA